MLLKELCRRLRLPRAEFEMGTLTCISPKVGIHKVLPASAQVLALRGYSIVKWLWMEDLLCLGSTRVKPKWQNIQCDEDAAS